MNAVHYLLYQISQNGILMKSLILSYMFYKCESLTYLPNISNWDIRQVTNMSYMFNECSSLSILPDISEWNFNKLSDINHMFYESLLYHHYLIFQNGIQVILFL